MAQKRIYLVSGTLNGKKIKQKIQADNIASAKFMTYKSGVRSIKYVKPETQHMAQLNQLKDKIDARMGTRRFKSKELMLISSVLSLVKSGGLSNCDSLKIVSESCGSEYVRKHMQPIIASARTGNYLHVAMRDNEKLFPNFFLYMIELGEQSGKPEEVLTKLAAYYEKDYLQYSKFKNMFIYPAGAMIVLIIVVYILSTKALPVLAQLFTSMNVKLEWYSLLLVNLGVYMQKYGFIVGGTLAAIAVGLIAWIRTPFGRYCFDSFKLKLPVIGPMYSSMLSAKFGTVLIIIKQSGRTMLDCLSIMPGIVDNKVMEKEIKEAEVYKQKGTQDKELLPLIKTLKPILPALFASGEEVGSGDKMTELAVKLLDFELELKMKTIQDLVQILITVLLGIVVALIIFAVLKPMVAMYKNISTGGGV